jgi:zeaxanthin glucosyltransferase
MANILFFIVHEAAALNTSFRLAGDLVARGHCVSDVGLIDSEETVTANGFRFARIFSRHFPKGSVGALSRQGAERLGFGHLLWELRKHAMFRRFVDDLITGEDEELFSLFDSLRPDLLVLSGGPYVEWPLLMAYSKGIRCVYLSSTIAPREGTGIPPMTSSVIPRHVSSWRAFRVWLAWKVENAGRKVNFLGQFRLTLRLAQKYGLADLLRANAYPTELSIPLPELIPYPACLDFPAPSLPDQHYIGASVCLDRNDGAFAWAELDAAKPLVYCALGTYLWRRRSGYVRFYREILGAACATPEWQWVVVIGASVDKDELGLIPANVVVVKHAPQLSLLRRAAVMVSHSGGTSLKECIMLGVPMVILPLGGDQPGFAARAIYHGIAEVADFDKVTAPQLARLTRIAMTNPYSRVQLSRMTSQFLEWEESAVGARCIESMLHESAAVGAADVDARLASGALA